MSLEQNVLTNFHDYHIRNNAPPPGGHVFQATGTIFELVQDIIGANLLTKFHDDRTINMASRVLTRIYFSYITKNATPPWRPYIISTNLVTKFHDDRTINVASKKKNAPPPDLKINVASKVLTRKNARPLAAMDNLLTKFHEDRTINVASRVKNTPPLGSHVFKANETIFKPIQDIIETNLLTKFHEDWK
ncbi:hypothetical protein DPMN_101692 [Dreissena polymorpha]|uniref:Uncharacterized protein n=1 Tax=Dreissena polymorpha TaxID=45954 RepID=A0A9D4LLL8_DREPO|nr:hypothetical protein DPMN_101692 [Dreissena polymorpha]